MRTPITTSLDRRYSDPKAEPTSWDETVAAIRQAELFWLTTVRPDGRPHTTPVVAAWADGAVHFTTGGDEQKGRNLRANPHVVLTTGCNGWESGLDVVVEGDAVLTTDAKLLERVADAFHEKWDGRWQFRAGAAGMVHPEGFEVLTYSVAPDKVLAFAKGLFGHTVHRMSSGGGRAGR